MTESTAFLTSSVFVVCDEPYHDNGTPIGAFTNRDRAMDYLMTKGEPQDEGDGFWSIGDDYYSVTEVQVNDHL